MKEKIKKIILGYLPGFITGLIICGGISVIAATYFPSNDVTYDNKESGLSSTNVQEAIDELYGVCFPPKAGNQIIEDAGLEKDPYECRYFFTGANPNNYITFNNEKAGWRIISVECDGTIKIMKDTSIGSELWDSSGSTDWSRPATLNTYLNEDYYNDELTATAKSQIVVKDFSIGTVTFDNNNLSTQINDENSKKWNGKVALITASEYIRSNSNKNRCGSFSLNNDDYRCQDTTWMFNEKDWWTLSPSSNNSFFALVINYSSGNISEDFVDWGGADILPTLYLNSDIKITGGNGSQSNPYIFE